MQAHEQELEAIRASSIWLATLHQTSDPYRDILNEAVSITNKHSKKFHNDFISFAKGFASGAANVMASGGVIPGVVGITVGAAVDAVIGVEELRSYPDFMLGHLGGYVHGKASGVIHSKAMMLVLLQKSFASDVTNLRVCAALKLLAVRLGTHSELRALP